MTATVQEDAGENLRDEPPAARPGAPRWEAAGTRTCYLGNEIEKVDERGEKFKWRVPGLDPAEVWERGLEPELRVTDETWERRVEDDDEMLKEGSEKTVVPAARPHEHVDMHGARVGDDVEGGCHAGVRVRALGGGRWKTRCSGCSCGGTSWRPGGRCGVRGGGGRGREVRTGAQWTKTRGRCWVVECPSDTRQR